MNAKRVTLADIAQKAGVHVTTVSLALRNSPQLPPATRARIQNIATSMGYAPDPILQALVAYRQKRTTRRPSNTLAYITNWDSRLGWKKSNAQSLFFSSAETTARSLGYTLEHFWLREPGVSPERLDSILYARGIRGIILASHGREMSESINLKWERYSVVKIDYYPHEPAFNNVTNNQYNTVRQAVKKALSKGYRRIGLVVHTSWDFAVDNLWSSGFSSVQQTMPVEDRIPAYLFPNQHPVRPWVEDIYTSPIVDPSTFSKWFQQHRPEVILCKRSFVQPVLDNLKLRVPDDVAIIDLFLSDIPGDTAGMRENHEKVGARAVETLARQLQDSTFGIPETHSTTFIEGTWIEGISCPDKAAPAPTKPVARSTLRQTERPKDSKGQKPRAKRRTAASARTKGT